MWHVLSRRNVLQATAMGSLGMLIPSLARSEEPMEQRPNPPMLNAELTKEFVVAGHRDLDRVKEMLASEPGLLNASWDWGGGDFETALEGAGHVGNREIALYLVGKGARLSVFQAAMLGELELVKLILKLHPEARSSKGPHGLDLIHHARKGGDKAVSVLEFLESKSEVL